MAARWTSFAKWAALGLGSLILLLALLLGITVSTGPGHRALSGVISWASDGQVKLDGLSGNLFSSIALDHLSIADDNGVWLRLEKLSLDWDSLALLHNKIAVSQVQAAKVEVLRRPVSKKTSTSKSEITLSIEHLAIARIVLGKAVLGHAAVLSAAGRLDYVSTKDLAAVLVIDRLDGSGRYRVALALSDGKLRGTAQIAEDGPGLAGGLAGLSEIGPLNLSLAASEKNSSNVVSVLLHAGELEAKFTGALDLERKGIDGAFTLAAPAMHPRVDLAWQSLRGKGHVSGPFTALVLDATLDIAGLSAGSAAISRLTLTAEGQGGRATLDGRVEGLQIAKDGGLFAKAPILVSVKADLSAKDTPVSLSVSHPLLSLEGSLYGFSDGRFQLTLPDLKKLSTLTGLDSSGLAHLTVDLKREPAKTALALHGEVSALGKTLPARLLGAKATLEANAALENSGWSLSGKLRGAALSASVDGRSQKGEMDVRAQAALSDMSRFDPTLHGSLSLKAHLSGPTDKMTLTAEGGGVAGVKGFARDRLDFTLAALGLPKLSSAELHLNGRLAGAPLALEARAVPAGDRVQFTLSHLGWKSVAGEGEATLAKGRPALAALRFSLGDLSDLEPFLHQALKGAVDGHVTLSPGGEADIALKARDLASGSLRLAKADLSGRIADALAAPQPQLKLSLTGLDSGGITGSVDADLSGSLAKPVLNFQAKLTTQAGPLTLDGHVLADQRERHIVLDRFQAQWGGRTLALADPAQFSWTGEAAAIHAKFSAGNSDALLVEGSVPLGDGEHFNLKLNGKADLAGWTQLLSAQGRLLRGKFVLDATMRGTKTKPIIDGTARVQDGQFQDFTAGIGLNKIEAVLAGSASAIVLQSFSAKAGSGTLKGSGTIGLTGTMPVSLLFEADKAQPLSRDGMSAVLGGKVTVSGDVKGDLKVEGKLAIAKGDIRLPDKLPPSIAVLNVRRKGEAPPKPSPPSRITLSVALSSPGRIFIRGRGLEAELEGDLTVGGTASRPLVSGVLTMRRGTFNLAGTTLAFKSGTIRFNGSSSEGRLDPAIAFVAESTANSVTATLTIGGTVSAPKLTLSSSPDLPQDEVLAHLLFGQSMQNLTGLQLAQIAQALMTLSGLDSGIDPVGAVRSGLGLDRLAVSNDNGSSVSSTTVEAGKYVFNNVYVGAKQTLSGGTRAQVQVDVTRHFKLEASVLAQSPATASTQSKDTGDTLGLSYSFDY